MEKLSPQALREAQDSILSSPKLRYGVLARLLFFTMDLFYGRKRSLSKFKVLEVIARVPYQAWEHVAYIAITHTYGKEGFARRVFERVKESRTQQDNEQWHLLILEEMVDKKDIAENFFLHRFVPQLIAFTFYHISWLLYVIEPEAAYRLNAHFEDHAEHEYMEYVRDNPDLEKEPFESIFTQDYGEFESVADLFRQIAVDERTHKEESLERAKEARFQ